MDEHIEARLEQTEQHAIDFAKQITDHVEREPRYREDSARAAALLIYTAGALWAYAEAFCQQSPEESDRDPELLSAMLRGAKEMTHRKAPWGIK